MLVVGLVATLTARADDPAVECLPLPPAIASAWASFNDAEAEEAGRALHEATEALACQPDVVPTEALLELFRLDGLVALAQADREHAVYATIRAVTIDPDNPPPTAYGPQLAELTATWQARLSTRSATVRVEGVDAAWIDGRPLAGPGPVAVVPGEHLVQWRDADGFHTAAVDFTGEHVIRGIPSTPVVDPRDPVEPRDPAKPRVGPLLIVGAVGIAAGGGAVLVAASQEQDFKADPWDAEAYGGCAVDDACYPAARREAIQGAAGRIRAIYAIGYGLAGVGIAGVGIDAFVIADSAGIPSGLGVRVPW